VSILKYNLRKLKSFSAEMPDGSTHLLLTPQTLLRRLAALVPPARQDLTRRDEVAGLPETSERI
jgi:hypothetical protein